MHDDIDEDKCVVETRKLSKDVKTDSEDKCFSVGTAKELPQPSDAVKNLTPVLTDEQAELRARNIIDEFLNCRDHAVSFNSCTFK